jgi:hypothetical protein
MHRGDGPRPAHRAPRGRRDGVPGRLEIIHRTPIPVGTTVQLEATVQMVEPTRVTCEVLVRTSAGVAARASYEQEVVARSEWLSRIGAASSDRLGLASGSAARPSDGPSRRWPPGPRARLRSERRKMRRMIGSDEHRAPELTERTERRVDLLPPADARAPSASRGQLERAGARDDASGVDHLEHGGGSQPVTRIVSWTVNRAGSSGSAARRPRPRGAPRSRAPPSRRASSAAAPPTW